MTMSCRLTSQVTVWSVLALMSALMIQAGESSTAGDETRESAAPGPGAANVPVTWVEHPYLGFAITATEVTVAQFRGCVEHGRCDAGNVNARCNYGIAGRDDHPCNCVNHVGAEQFCSYAGGRLCTEDEWLRACRGTDNRPFPYGQSFDLSVCNSSSATSKLEGRGRGTVPVSSLSECEGGLPGLYDMAGNVAEWLADCKGTYCKFRGGGHWSNDPIEYFAACLGVCAGNQRSLQSNTVGIRCCQDTVAVSEQEP
jgi:formylglycine-generating enzyme required for sulfatase activity